MKFTKIAVCMAITTSLCSCSGVKQASVTDTKDKEKIVSSGTPTREDFVPLAPPVMVKGSPEDAIKKKRE